MHILPVSEIRVYTLRRSRGFSGPVNSNTRGGDVQVCGWQRQARIHVACGVAMFYITGTPSSLAIWARYTQSPAPAGYPSPFCPPLLLRGQCRSRRFFPIPYLLYSVASDFFSVFSRECGPIPRSKHTHIYIHRPTTSIIPRDRAFFPPVTYKHTLHSAVCRVNYRLFHP